MHTALGLSTFVLSARAFSPGCGDECTPFWALSCPSNDPTCLSTYCSSNSYDLYETCLACWQANPDPNVVTTQTSLIYQYICNLVYQCSLRKVTIAGPAPSNIGCAAPGWNGAASHGITPWTGSGAPLVSSTAGTDSGVAVTSTPDTGTGAATASSTAGAGTSAGTAASMVATGTGVAAASSTGTGAAVVSSSSAAGTSAAPSASVSKNSKAFYP
ncbi:uncharacterized protein LOC62_04G006478 [Vanrija pseudolonga]|uniref:Extracellular membrane protein CFEM domain-containing protein n=1 Tax=Vanrija pseudolonga TaxID=143232 RepID=A0AAF0YAE1_9TREE|nr:hypothetical protein LOC62_04G006478 [Vanrija pseudolonga]